MLCCLGINSQMRLRPLGIVDMEERHNLLFDNLDTKAECQYISVSDRGSIPPVFYVHIDDSCDVKEKYKLSVKLSDNTKRTMISDKQTVLRLRALFRSSVNTATFPFSITENNKIVDLSSSPVRDTALHGSVELTKVDADSNTGAGQGDADLSGAEFTIYNNSAKAIYFGGKKIEVGGIVTVITTDASGNAATAEKSLPYGTYKIKETKAPTG